MSKVGAGAAKQALPYKGFAQQQFDILLSPVSSGKRLKKHHDLLEVHLDQLVGPLDQEGRADVQVELGEALLLGLVSGQQAPYRRRPGNPACTCPTS